MDTERNLHVRTHGSGGPFVIVLHGGPAAAGEAAPLARGIAGSFRVLEPWQRGSGGEPLTVARHVADLHAVMTTHCPGARPALVGESWGAMLALAFAAAHPEDTGPLVLVGCGTFDPAARARMREILDERTDAALKERLALLDATIREPGERLREQYRLIEPLYSYDPLPDDPEDVPPFDARAHRETWDDMVRLQEAGVYPASFAEIGVPVLMLHGAYDPHPGEMIRASLQPYIPRLEYREFARCGHSPWRERQARDEFFTALSAWLEDKLTDREMRRH